MNNEKEQLYHSEYEKRLPELRLLDDDFMKLVFDQDTASTGQLLQVILDNPDLTVTASVSKKEIKSAYGKSMRCVYIFYTYRNPCPSCPLVPGLG